jgi:hypothetical protein
LESGAAVLNLTEIEPLCFTDAGSLRTATDSTISAYAPQFAEMGIEKE